MSKRPILVAYDYDQGGVWAFLLAESEGDIRRRFPELQVVSARPHWMDAAEEQRIRDRMTIDIDDVEGSFLAAVIKGRKKND
jgi:hypothetical protein